MDTRLQQLFQVLRWCGAAMIVAAAGTFLVQSWDRVDDVIRYLTLLGITAALPALAYVCGIGLREGRSARVLMLTLLALVPIHAGVLGGFVLSQFGASAESLAPVAQWVAPSPSAALLLVAAAGLTLLPLLWSAYRVLCRSQARLLTGASAATHALLLVPDRSALAATLSLVPILAVAGWCAQRIKPQTLESRLALISLIAPAAVISARQILFYDVSSAFFGTILGTVAVGIYLLGRKIGDASVERVASVPMLASVAAFLCALDPMWRLSASSVVLTYGTLAAVPLLAFAWTSANSKGFYVRAVVSLNAATAASTLLWAPRPWAALQAIALGLGLLSYGFVRGRRTALYSGISLASFGFIVEVAHAIEVFEASGWLALASFGFALVGLTAWLERRSRTAKLSGPVPTVVPQ